MADMAEANFMQDEMARFEEEISFSAIQAAAPPPPPPVTTGQMIMPNDLSMQLQLPPPPPPPSNRPTASEDFGHRGIGGGGQPRFMPHALQRRPPPPPPRMSAGRPPFGHPPSVMGNVPPPRQYLNQERQTGPDRYHPAPPPGSGPFGQRPPSSGPPPRGPVVAQPGPPPTTGGVISAAPKIYSAAPVLTKKVEPEAKPAEAASATTVTASASMLVPSSVLKRPQPPLSGDTAAGAPSSGTSILPQPPQLPSQGVGQAGTTQGGGAERDATPNMGGEETPPVAGGGPPKAKKPKKDKRTLRCAGGQSWEDQSLLEWDPDDFRMFCGDLGTEVTDDTLARAFARYASFARAKVVRDRRSNKSKGYGFISFKDPDDFARAMREMNGKYVGSRPIKLRKSQWRDRCVHVVKKKEKEKKKLGLR